VVNIILKAPAEKNGIVLDVYIKYYVSFNDNMRLKQLLVLWIFLEII